MRIFLPGRTEVLFSLGDKEMFVMEMCELIFHGELLKLTDGKHSEVMRQRNQAQD